MMAVCDGLEVKIVCDLACKNMYGRSEKREASIRWQNLRRKISLPLKAAEMKIKWKFPERVKRCWVLIKSSSSFCATETWVMLPRCVDITLSCCKKRFREVIVKALLASDTPEIIVIRMESFEAFVSRLIVEWLMRKACEGKLFRKLSSLGHWIELT